MDRRIVVLMAFRGDGEGFGGTGWRDRAYTHIRPHVESLGWPLFVADSGDQPFSVSKSYNQAADDAGDWDVAVLHPPDEWVPYTQLRRAVDACQSGMVYAFDRDVRLTEAGTEAFFDGQRVAFMGDHVAGRRPGKRWKTMPDWAGPRAISRDVWDRCGGFDERVRGWGAEDEILAHCARVYGTVSRIPGEAVAPYHPRHDGTDFFAHKNANRAVLAEYRKHGTVEDLDAYLEAHR